MAKRSEKLLTVAQASDLTGLSKSTLYAGLLGTDKLRRIELRTNAKGRATIRFYESDLREWIKTQISTASPKTRRANRRRTQADQVIDLLQWKQKRA